MNKFLYLFFFTVFSILIFSVSCVSSTNINTVNNSYEFSSFTKFNDSYFAIERDYNSESKNKTNGEILDAIASEIEHTLLSYNIKPLVSTKEDTIQFFFNSTKENIENVFKNITSDKNNPILYYENDDIKININRDNYMDIKAFLPILENETVYAYTAAFNSDTSKEEYIEIISYVLTEDIAISLDKCQIDFSISDENITKNISFTLLDFLLLHSPITL